MIHRLMCFVLVLLTCCVNGQNLVMNPSFEETPCDSNWFPLSFPAEFWFNPNNATPDYFSTSFGPNGCGIVQAPLEHDPRSGDFMVGLWGGQLGSPTREFIQSELSSPLVEDSSYCIECYIQRSSTSEMAIDRIGMMLSADSLYDTSTASGLNGGLVYLSSEPGQFLVSSEEWILLSWEYTAQGGERFITVGNHWSEDATEYLEISAGSLQLAYYYVDDISVTLCGATSIEEWEEDLAIGPNPVSDKLMLRKPIDLNHIQIYSVSGRLVLDLFSNGQIVQIDMSELSNGVYILDMYSDNHSETYRTKLLKVN